MLPVSYWNVIRLRIREFIEKLLGSVKNLSQHESDLKQQDFANEQHVDESGEFYAENDSCEEARHEDHRQHNLSHHSYAAKRSFHCV